MNSSATTSGLNFVNQNQLHELQHINLQLAALGQPTCELEGDQPFLKIADGLLKNYSQHRRLLANYRCPADQRIQDFLNEYLHTNNVEDSIRLPGETFVLEHKGLARELSLPFQQNEFHSAYVDSYRMHQGVLHNPKNDRRTTKGVFHIVEGGLPVPDDKNQTPIKAYAELLRLALSPPMICYAFLSQANRKPQQNSGFHY